RRTHDKCGWGGFVSFVSFVSSTEHDLDQRTGPHLTANRPRTLHSGRHAGHTYTDDHPSLRVCPVATSMRSNPSCARATTQTASGDQSTPSARYGRFGGEIRRSWLPSYRTTWMVPNSPSV